SASRSHRGSTCGRDAPSCGTDCSARPPWSVYAMSGFDEIYREHVDGVFRFAVRLVGRRDVAEDITSEVFLELHRNFASLEPERLPAWLFTVAKNRARDYWRRQTLEQRFLAEAVKTTPTMEEPRSEHALFNNPALKPVHRVCLVLRYVYGMARGE